MKPGLVLLLITIIQAKLVLSNPSKKWKVLQASVQNGFYGRDLTIKRGKEILCDIKAASSPNNTTCKDNQSLVFLQSNNSLSLITEATTNNYYPFEYNGETLELHHNGTFDSQEEALNYINPMVKQNLTNPIPRAAENLPDSKQNFYWLLILLLIPLALAIFWIKQRNKSGQYYCRETDPNIGNGELEPCNSQDTNTAQPIIITQNGTHSNGVLLGQDISMAPMDSDFQTSNV
ncbi:uncharacterized protein [Aquarana catesbeiana]|uniref:uncharacterized protein n=1 Tax=Aquarana catesbeiana TaxID=8400 RepID=UPI003CCA4E4D